MQKLKKIYFYSQNFTLWEWRQAGEKTRMSRIRSQILTYKCFEKLVRSEVTDDQVPW